MYLHTHYTHTGSKLKYTHPPKLQNYGLPSDLIYSSSYVYAIWYVKFSLCANYVWLFNF